MIYCPRCHSSRMKRQEVIHHILCAYVGPEADFKQTGKSHICPKCHRQLKSDHSDNEIIGHCISCLACGYEESEGVS